MSEPIAAPSINEEKIHILIGKVSDIDARPGAGKRAFGALADDGSFMIFEPMAGTSVEDDLNPVGRTFPFFDGLLHREFSRARRFGFGRDRNRWRAACGRFVGRIQAF